MSILTITESNYNTFLSTRIIEDWGASAMKRAKVALL